MTEHTPGPWRTATLAAHDASQDSPTHYESVIKGVSGFTIATMCEPHGKDAPHSADAMLIAAAPETAAERDHLREINAELLAALKDGRHVVRNLTDRSIAMCRFLDDADDAIAKAESNEDAR